VTCLHCAQPKPAREILVTWCQQDVCTGCLNYHLGHCHQCLVRTKKQAKGVK